MYRGMAQIRAERTTCTLPWEKILQVKDFAVIPQARSLGAKEKTILRLFWSLNWLPTDAFPAARVQAEGSCKYSSSGGQLFSDLFVGRGQAKDLVLGIDH